MYQAILVFLLIIYPLFSEAKEISYPTNQVERPLTLPDGIWELGGEVWYSQRQNDSNSISYPVLSLRYGITDNLEFYPLGLKYRILRNAPFEFVIKGRIIGFEYSTTSGTGQSPTTETSIFTEAGIKAKQRVNSKLAIIYRLEDYYAYRSNNEDDTDIGISLGGVSSFTERLSLEFTGMYKRLWGLNKGEGRVFKAVIYYNTSSTFDILLEGVFSNYKNEVRYLPENFRGTSYGIGLNWRF